MDVAVDQALSALHDALADQVAVELQTIIAMRQLTLISATVDVSCPDGRPLAAQLRSLAGRDETWTFPADRDHVLPTTADLSAQPAATPLTVAGVHAIIDRHVARAHQLRRRWSGERRWTLDLTQSTWALIEREAALAGRLREVRLRALARVLHCELVARDLACAHVSARADGPAQTGARAADRSSVQLAGSARELIAVYDLTHALAAGQQLTVTCAGARLTQADPGATV